MGETIQSYNHQSHGRKEESSEKYYPASQPAAADDDNIDVVNDDDEDSGKHFCNFVVQSWDLRSRKNS